MDGKSRKERQSEAYKKYYATHRDELNARNRAYYQANKERIAEQKRAYYAAGGDALREKGAQRQRAWAMANPLGSRARKYGVTANHLTNMLEEQNHACASCASPFELVRDMVVDHDHACCPGSTSCGACVRSFLCRRCNTVIGLCQDETTVLQSAIAYLDRWKR